MDRILASFKKNNKEQVRITLSAFKGKQILNIRVYYQSKSGEWLPSRKGLAFIADKLPILLAALHQAHQMIGPVSVEMGPASDVSELSEEEIQHLSDSLGVSRSEISEIFSEER